MARPEKIKTALGQRLTDVRKALGYRARPEFAREIGVAADTLGTYERGDREPDSEILAQYRRRFGVNLDWLIAGLGDMLSPRLEPANRIQSSKADPIFTELVVRTVGQMVDELHRQMKISLPQHILMGEIGRAVGEVLEMLNGSTDPEHVRHCVNKLEDKLRSKLKVAAAAPGTGKREVS